MKPYYEEPGITIYCGDCRDILPQLQPVDVVVTDPPYGVGLEYPSCTDSYEQVNEWHFVIEKCRLMANVVSFTPGNLNQYMYHKPTWTLCWFNRAGAGSGPWGFSCWQPIMCYGPDPYLANGLGRRPDYIEWNEPAEKNGHPCPKPLGFVKQWITRVSLSGTILDPFMGSGTILRAAKDLGRPAIGIEIEPMFCDIAIKRLAQEVLPL